MDINEEVKRMKESLETIELSPNVEDFSDCEKRYRNFSRLDINCIISSLNRDIYSMRKRIDILSKEILKAKIVRRYWLEKNKNYESK